MWKVAAQAENSPFQLVDRGPASATVAVSDLPARAPLQGLLPAVRPEPGAVALCGGWSHGHVFVGHPGPRVVQGHDRPGRGGLVVACDGRSDDDTTTQP